MLSTLQTILEISIIKWLLISTASIAIALYLIFRYIEWKCDYWQKQGVRTDSVGLYTRLMKSSFDWERDLYVRNGKCFGVYELGKPVLYLSDPELIRDVLVKDFHIFNNRRERRTGVDHIFEHNVGFSNGAEWKRMRTSLSPMFTATGKLKRMTPLILECVDTMNDTIDNIIASSNGILSAPVDVKRMTGAYAMESTIQMTFSRKVSALNDPNNPIIENVRRIHKNSLLALVKLSTIMLAPYVARMLRISQFDSKATHFFRDFTLNLIDERKRVSETESAVKRVDFLQLMLDSMRDNNNQAIDGSDDYTDSKGGEKYGEKRTTAGMRDKGLSYDEIIAQCVMNLIAGYDSISITISICLYSIAKHPEVQQTLYEEINTFYEQKKSMADIYESLNAMNYMNAVVDEAIRLYQGSKMERISSEDYVFKGTGITIKKGHVVQIPTYAMHRDPANFADPEAFRPERFLPENKAHNPYTYLPFGGGPRICLGMHMVKWLVKLALVSLVHRYVFHTTEKPLQFYVSNGGLIPKAVYLKIGKRE